MKAGGPEVPVRLVAFFSGQVQGVGFRFTVLNSAAEFPELTGFVRNLNDGRVEMVVEGPRDALNRLLAAVQQRMRSYVSQAEVSRGPATGEFAGFNVSH